MHFMKPRHRFLLVLLSCAALCGCDEGLKPSPAAVQTGYFSGVIRYRHWPSSDSLHNLRLIAFRSRPASQSAIIYGALNGTAVLYPSALDTTVHLPYLVDSTVYVVNAGSGTYAYVVVGQQFGPNIQADWRVAGQYTFDPANIVPAPIEIPPLDTLKDVNITVDFASPPPQPF